MAKRGRILFIFRVAFLLIWLFLALGLAWVYHSGRIPDAESIFRASEARTKIAKARTKKTIVSATMVLKKTASPDDMQEPGLLDKMKIEAASKLAAIGLARHKAYRVEGYSMQLGVDAADARLANDDPTDLHEAVPALVRALGSSEERLRLEAAYALANLHLDERHVDYVLSLGQALKKEFSPGVKAYLARALGDIGIGPQRQTAVPELEKLLLETDPYILATAARAFAKIGPLAYRESAEARLVVLVQHPDAEVREAAAQALGSTGAYSREAEQILRSALADPSPWVQCAAAVALMDLGHQDEDLVVTAARVFQLPPKTTLFVDDILWNRAVKKRVAAQLDKRGIVPDAAAEDLANFVLQSNDYLANSEAVKTLARSKHYNADRADALVKTLLKKRGFVYGSAVKGLAAMGPQVTPHLEPLLTHRNPNRRDLGAAVLATVEFTDPKTIQCLVEHASQGGQVAGIESVQALGSIRGADALATRTLVNVLREEPIRSYKAEACKALGRIGPGAQNAIMELAKWSAHDDDRVRPHAMTAMTQIAPDHPETLKAMRAMLAEKLYKKYSYHDVFMAGWPAREQLTPDFIRAFEQEESDYSKEHLVKIMTWHGDPAGLACIQEHADEKLFHNTVINVAMAFLVREIGFKKLTSDAERADCKRAIELLGALGLLDAEEKAANLAAMKNPELAERLWKKYNVYSKQRAGPQPPTMEEQLAALYGPIPQPRNRALVNYLKRLHDPYVGTRKNAVKSLSLQAKQGAVEAPGILAAAFADPSEDVRVLAVMAFAEHGLAREEHKAGLTLLLNSDVKYGRENEFAAIALASLGDAGVDELLKASHSEVDTIRRAAVWGLLKAGAAAEKTRPRLEELAKDPHRAVSHYAKAALEQLDENKGGTGL